MGTSQDLRWRKSSYSGPNGGDCIECAPLGTAAWRKSSFSGSSGGECIEVADLTAHIAVRDSKNPEGPAFLATPAAFAAFVGAAAEGRLR
ncbi:MULTISPECIES: DUF397 domain-containing protein [Streptomyces]|uniref:DUF397 domain-containing protein n=1 Tax=Streptomyces venezuelae TaxID=54571 RepID=A0A5P2AY61_STRVZ|nr:DUF397 domain-containing protein [Streptomyces venezuelae]QES22488.1 DUF397 domain-containing protein [Streptomyces venezuelae]